MGDKRKNVYASSCEEIVTGEGLYLSYINTISPSTLIYLMSIELFTAEEVLCQKTLIPVEIENATSHLQD